MPDDDNVDVRLLLPHAGGLRVEGGQWGERWGRSCVYGEAVRGKKGSVSTAPTTALPAQTGVRGHGSAALLMLGQIQPAPGGDWPGYFWPPHSASSSQQDTMILSSAFLETPSSQGYVIGTSKVPFLCGKKKKQPNLLMALHRCLLGLSKPYSISKPSISWAPWEEPWVPVPSGCLHLLGDNMVPKKRDGQK